MIPYTVGKVAPNSTHFTRGLDKYVPGRGYFRAVPSQNGDKIVTFSPPPIVERFGDGAGTVTTGTGVETRGRTQDGNGDGNRDGSENSSGDGNEDADGSGNEDTMRRVEEERRKSTRNRTRVVDAMWETGETWVERGKNVENKGFGPIAANPDNLENKKDVGGGA